MHGLNKYFKLMYKDIIIQKGILLLVVFYILMPCFINNEMYKSSLFIVTNMMIVSEILFANISYFYVEEKSKGNLLLITTSYTRSDIAVSKYLFLMVLGFVQLLITYCIVYANLGSQIVNLKNLYDFILNILFLNITVAFVTPLCFFQFSALAKTFVACMICSVIECVPMVINFGRYTYCLSLNEIIFFSVLVSAVIVCGSIFVSNKIFKSRDL